ncbi:hypothetical protein NL676_019126 [Syzygium grande]|nr:hypothetical protein NL676_019126 [Syzygium grande]
MMSGRDGPCPDDEVRAVSDCSVSEARPTCLQYLPGWRLRPWLNAGRSRRFLAGYAGTGRVKVPQLTYAGVS